MGDMPTSPPTEAPSSELTVTQASERENIPKRSIHRAVERGQLPARRIGNLLVLDSVAVRLYGDVFRARRALNAYTGYDGSADE